MTLMSTITLGPAERPKAAYRCRNFPASRNAAGPHRALSRTYALTVYVAGAAGSNFLTTNNTMNILRQVSITWCLRRG